jgi:hypothetical protein
MQALDARINRIRLGAATLPVLGLLACSASINASLDHKECSAQGECLAGFTCSEERLCVKQASTKKPPSEADAGLTADAALEPRISTSSAAETGQSSGAMPEVPACDAGAPCAGACVDLASDPNHCGGCGRRCPGTERGRAICGNGACDLVCEEGYTRCGDGCYLLGSDAQHCGSCAFSCPSGANSDVACVEGTCRATCKPGFQDCGGECVRLDTDARHCGACATACSAEQRCSAGACVRACAAGTLECAQSCVDPKTDAQHCGTCAQACTAPAGATAVCSNAVCSIQCGTGLTACGAACVNTQTDAANCGGCGQQCPAMQSHSHGICEAGACKTECDFGYVACDAYCISFALLSNERAFAVCAVLAAAQGD